MKNKIPLARKSPMKPSAKPMARGTSTLKQKAPLRAKQPMARTASTKKAPAQRSTLKSKGPRMTPIRKAARGQDCTLNFPGICNHDPATVVLCHSNFLADGKGMGLKAPDSAACFGCASCHDVLDGRRPRPDGFSLLDVEGAFYAAMRRTHDILRTIGLMP